jgi:hypothetical protein
VTGIGILHFLGRDAHRLEEVAAALARRESRVRLRFRRAHASARLDVLWLPVVQSSLAEIIEFEILISANRLEILRGETRFAPITFLA